MLTEDMFKAFKYIRKISGKNAVIVLTPTQTFTVGLSDASILEFIENYFIDRVKPNAGSIVLSKRAGTNDVWGITYGEQYHCNVVAIDDYPSDYVPPKLTFNETIRARKMVNAFSKSDFDNIITFRSEPKTHKGYKTAVYGRKGHRDGITQLENSVRNMF